MENWKEKLNDLLNCDIKSLFPLARALNRKLVFYVGPTNSGKTYQAMQKLKNSDSGLYLAPLRLLALEGFENFKEENIPVSLITGEEENFNEDAAHICSTIEMIDFNLDVDTCVIDEVQMIDDIDRGWAWVNAIIGAPAKTVIMTGSVNALDSVKKLAEYLDEELEVIKVKRKTELQVLDKAINLRDITPNTALIAFSRADVLRLKQKLQKYHKVAVLYGNLSPEVRREEARRFREAEADILIATDAIAMGLNLPIKTLLFTTDTKFDGISKRKLLPTEVTQISGRAGRYGHHEIGYIGGIDNKTHQSIAHIITIPIKTIKGPFNVKATLDQIISISEHLQSKNLFDVLKFYVKHMNFDGPFLASNISSMLQIAMILDKKRDLSLEQKFIFANAPVSVKSPLIQSAFFSYIEAIIRNKPLSYRLTTPIKNSTKDPMELLKVEDEIKKISLYLWLSFKFPNVFFDQKKAKNFQIQLNQYIENSLKKGIKFIRNKENNSPRKHNHDRSPRRPRRRFR